MALCLATREQLNALPLDTEYRVIADRPDLFGGCLAVEVRGTAVPSGWKLAPVKYPNGVSLLDGCAAPREKRAPVVDRLADVSDAEILKAANARSLDAGQLLGLDAYREEALTRYRLSPELAYGDPVIIGPDGFAQIVFTIDAPGMKALLSKLNDPLADAVTAERLCKEASAECWARLKAESDTLDAAPEPLER
ncbi:MAG: hypothetical protein WC789_09275 [Lentisphaeria bacterium]